MGIFSRTAAVLAAGIGFALPAGAGGPRCDQVFAEQGRPAKLSPADIALENRYYGAQYYVFGKIASLMDGVSLPQMTKIEVGPYSLDPRSSTERIRETPLEEIRATEAEWSVFERMHQAEWQSRVSIADPFMFKPYAKEIVATETYSAEASPVARALPAKVRERYARLLRPGYEFPGRDKTEQTVEVGVHMAFSALKALIVRGEDGGSVPPADLALLSRLFDDGWKMRPIRFAGEREMSFSPDPSSPHRLILTGSEPGSPIVFNRDRLAALLQSKSLAPKDLAGLIIHELSHHLGLKDDAARVPDRLGALVTKMVADNGEVRNLDPEGRVKLHMLKWGFRPKQWRTSYEDTTFSLILEDNGKFLNLNPYIRQNPEIRQGTQQNALLTLRDFDVKVIHDGEASRIGYEVQVNFQVEKSSFDVAAYERDHGPIPLHRSAEIIDPTEWEAAGGYANPNYQTNRQRFFTTRKIHFLTDGRRVDPSSIFVDKGQEVPATWSAASSTLSKLSLKEESPGVFRGQVVLKDYVPPKDARLGLVARREGIEDLPLLGETNAIPLTVEKATPTPEGLQLEFRVDDRAGLTSRTFDVGELLVVAEGKQALLPVASGVKMVLPPKAPRPLYHISGIDVQKMPEDASRRQVVFQLENATQLQDVVLILEVQTLNEGARYERKLLAMDAVLASDPRARDAWERSWFEKMEGFRKSPTTQVHRMVFDPSVFADDSKVMSVRVHSLYVRDADLRRDQVPFPERAVLFSR